MQRRVLAFVLVPLLLTSLPKAVHAGGPEFPAGGTRMLGRGAAGFARADDPSLMFRNPALLADLWDDQAMLGAHLLLPDACMQPTGAYGWGVSSNDVSDFGEGPVFLQADATKDTDLKGKPLQGYGKLPYPNVCYQGPAPFLPQLAFSMKLAPDLGVGFGFFPPDTAALNQWGNRDGTIDVDGRKLPNPLRYYRSHLNVTFFTLLGAVGYRLADWLSVGAAFQWNVVAFSGRSWTGATTTRDPRNDVKSDVFGRDLFIPGVVLSAQVRPADFFDIAIGFKWADRVRSNAKIDITSGAYGTGEVFQYKHTGTDGVMTTESLGSTIPTTTSNVRTGVDSPPVWTPQLMFGIRFADRLKPKAPDMAKAKLAAGQVVEDHMQTERWDIEADAVYYFNTVYDATKVRVPADTTLALRPIGPNGEIGLPQTAYVGKCQHLDASNRCTGDRTLEYPFKGKNQISARVGGDYNLFPGLFSLRAGVSYEQNGQDPRFNNLLQYMLGRTGIHAGFTLRVAGKTDISFGFAHFFQKGVKLQVNELDTTTKFPQAYKPDPTMPDANMANYHFQPGLGIADKAGNNANAKNGFDGLAQVELPNGDLSRTIPGPDYINAGTFYYHLDVVSLTFTQHF